MRLSRIRRRIMGCRIYVFLYVIDCHNLPSKDTFSPSDSYLKVSIGNQSDDVRFVIFRTHLIMFLMIQILNFFKSLNFLLIFQLKVF
jgi:hypothetical protein